ncbi:MAG TPA: GntR family transcriptional regulator [Thermoleophilaceae bacterium]|nr:GntR family transcriptional regulator [Thermoleophilaceae bacterium]
MIAAPLRDQVYERLRSAILGGEIPAGERISPPELAERLGVSTTPVREALRSLEEEGLIETSPRRWTRVASPSPDLAAETYPVIATLEELAVSSITTVTPELLEELRSANRDFERAAAAGDVFACMTANDAFHGALLRANGNGTLERTLRDLKTRIRLLDSQYFQSGTETSIREHEQVIEALEQGDVDRAAAVIRGQWVRWLPAWGVSPADH